MNQKQTSDMQALLGVPDKWANERATRERMAIQSPIVEPIGNLEYCTAETRTMIEAILADDSVHFATKDAIRAGLNRDCLDAARDARLASLLLDSVYRDCTRIID